MPSAAVTSWDGASAVVVPVAVTTSGATAGTTLLTLSCALARLVASTWSPSRTSMGEAAAAWRTATRLWPAGIWLRSSS